MDELTCEICEERAATIFDPLTYTWKCAECDQEYGPSHD
jgi:hypothetical protein